MASRRHFYLFWNWKSKKKASRMKPWPDFWCLPQNLLDFNMSEFQTSGTILSPSKKRTLPSQNCPKPILFDLMEIENMTYLNAFNWMQMRQGCIGESGVSWPVAPKSLEWLSWLWHSWPPPHWIKPSGTAQSWPVSISISTRCGKPLSLKREYLFQNIYFSMILCLIFRFSVLWAQEFAGNIGGQ